MFITLYLLQEKKLRKMCIKESRCSSKKIIRKKVYFLCSEETRPRNCNIRLGHYELAKRMGTKHTDHANFDDDTDSYEIPPFYWDLCDISRDNWTITWRNLDEDRSKYGI